MPFYVTLSEGPRADQAHPILALSDQRVIRALLRAIARLDSKTGPTEQSGAVARVLSLVGEAEGAPGR